MGARLEFSKKVRDQAAIRAKGICEKCKLPFGGKRPEFDHILPAELKGKPELANCQVLCRPCHVAKTGVDVRMIRKGDRQRQRANGAKQVAGKIKSRGFQTSRKQPRIAKPALPPRELFRCQ